MLLRSHRTWLRFASAALDVLRDQVDVSRLVQVYRAPLRVGRQIPAAAYELHACAQLVEVVRRLELDVRTRGRRRADVRAMFLSQAFHMEVKSHEDRSGRRRRGGAAAVRSLWEAARAQASDETPNLLALGHVDAAAVRRAIRDAPRDEPFGAVVWLDLRPRTQRWHGALYRVRGARRPFPPPLYEVLRHRFQRVAARAW